MLEPVWVIILNAKNLEKIRRYAYFSNTDRQIQIVYVAHHLVFSI
jgi:hypothetical protein